MEDEHAKKAEAIVAELFPPNGEPIVAESGAWAVSWGESPKSVRWLVDTIAAALREAAAVRSIKEASK